MGKPAAYQAAPNPNGVTMANATMKVKKFTDLDERLKSDIHFAMSNMEEEVGWQKSDTEKLASKLKWTFLEWSNEKLKKSRNYQRDNKRKGRPNGERE